ncbi:helix-turn-helix domain-containing protein [Vibrio vulnificus]|nr:helix-turn-helix domain-containing protein [Vibrio vulnificus]
MTTYRNKPRFQTNDSFESFTVHIEVLKDEALTPNQKLVLSLILAGFQGSQRKMGELLGINERTISNIIFELTDLDYILPIRKGLFNMYRVEAEAYQHLVIKGE